MFLKKLGRLRVDSKTIKLKESFISERKQRVLINNVNSDEIILERGVPQGTVLGPLLFNFYINDLQDQIDKNCELVQYADDTLLLFSAPIQHKYRKKCNIADQIFHKSKTTIHQKLNSYSSATTEISANLYE